MNGLYGAMPVPIEAQIACVEREIGMRQSVYARRVSEKKMSQADADKKIDLMRAVLDTLRGVDLLLQDKERDHRAKQEMLAANAAQSAVIVQLREALEDAKSHEAELAARLDT